MSEQKPGSNRSTSNNAKKKKKKKRKHPIRNTFLVLFIMAILGGLVATGIIGGYVYKVLQNTEPISEMNLTVLLDENSVILDSNGNLLEKVQSGSLRTLIPYEEMDPDLINAFIAVEDKTFWEHHGFNYVRLAGAAVESMKTGEGPRGTSTITQQLARNLYLTDTRLLRSYERKVKEAYYAYQLEERLSKEQIVAMYLNTIDLGGNASGVQAAAQTYFSKDASEIDLIEAAMLAGLPKAPSTYSPFKYKKNEDVEADDYVLGTYLEEYTIVFNERCLDRYNVVLHLMKENGYITESEYETAKNTDIRAYLKPGRTKNSDVSSYFSDMVKEDVIDALVEEKGMSKEEATRVLFGGGLKIYSTMDINLQKKLEEAYNPTTFNNVFDDKTRSAVIAFQKKYGLGSDGVVGKSTLKKLEELEQLSLEDFTHSTYSRGMVDDEVIRLKEALEREGLLFKSNDKMPTIKAYKDQYGNILSLQYNKNKTLTGSEILLNKYSQIITDNDDLRIHSNSFKYDSSGNLVLKSDTQFNFYRAYDNNGEVSDIVIYIKDAYKSDEDREKTIAGGGRYYSKRVSIPELYIYKGGSIRVPYEYKTFDDQRNMIVKKEFLDANPNFFTKDAEGNLIVSKDNYSISKTGIIQPQSAMVLIDYRTGHLKAIVGGRNVSGQKIFNRATNPRQPGSSIKPIGVYLPAIDHGITAATIYDDRPRYNQGGQRWPYNWYEYSEFKYRGLMTVREALKDSNNVIPVDIANELGVENCIPYLKKLGISTLVESGNINDINPSSVALGGMTKGIKPIDLASAYGSIANGGVRVEPITFTRIEDRDGTVIVERTPEKTFVVDEKVAFIVQDMMESSVQAGVATSARMDSQPVAGKTGTTSNKYDAWFVGYTPYYVASVWIGNDVNMDLSDGSKISAEFWKGVMTDIHQDLPRKEFEVPDGLLRLAVDTKSGKIPTELSQAAGDVTTEYFIPGTQPTEYDETHVQVDICTASNKLVNPEFCPADTIETQIRIQRPEPYVPEENLDSHGNPILIKDSYLDLPTELCDVHDGQVIDMNYTSKYFYNVHIEPTFEGQMVLMEPAVAVLKDQTYWKLPVGTLIQQDGSIHMADGTILQPWQFEMVYPDAEGQ